MGVSAFLSKSFFDFFRISGLSVGFSGIFRPSLHKFTRHYIYAFAALCVSNVYSYSVKNKRRDARNAFFCIRSNPPLYVILYLSFFNQKRLALIIKTTIMRNIAIAIAAAAIATFLTGSSFFSTSSGSSMPP